MPNTVQTGGEFWKGDNQAYQDALTSAAQTWGGAQWQQLLQVMMNMGRLETNWTNSGSMPGGGWFQMSPDMLKDMQKQWGYPVQPTEIVSASDALARYIVEMGTGTGLGAHYGLPISTTINFEVGPGTWHGGRGGYTRFLTGNTQQTGPGGDGIGPLSTRYTVQALQGVLGQDQLSLPLQTRFEQLYGVNAWPQFSGAGIGSDVPFGPQPLAGVDPTDAWLDPGLIPSAEALRTQPGLLTALQGAGYQALGFLPGWGYDYSSHTWQDTGGVGGWSLMDTSNPDVVESKLFEQWLPKGFQAAGPEVWEETPLQFWVPDWSTDLLPSGASLQSGQAPFDLFNSQGQFDVNMLNAPGAVSPELGGWLQQQGIVNPSKGYNPVNQVWQDAPPAPGWQLINTTNVDPVYQQQITQQMSSLFPMGHFDNIFEGTGANPWSGPPVQNWLPPPAPGSSYHFGMVPGTSSSSTIAPGSGFGVIEGAEGLGYQGSAGITTIDPGILGLGATINANAQQMIAQAQAQAAAFNAQQQFHNQQMLNQVTNPWGGGWQPGFGLLY